MPVQPKEIHMTESLPIQLLISGLPPDRGAGKFGCLVFMVGTEMIQAGLESDSAPAFYTELDTMVKVFRTLAYALINSAQGKPPATGKQR